MCSKNHLGRFEPSRMLAEKNKKDDAFHPLVPCFFSSPSKCSESFRALFGGAHTQLQIEQSEDVQLPALPRCGFQIAKRFQTEPQPLSAAICIQQTLCALKCKTKNSILSTQERSAPKKTGPTFQTSYSAPKTLFKSQRKLKRNILKSLFHFVLEAAENGTVNWQQNCSPDSGLVKLVRPAFRLHKNFMKTS